MPNYDFDVHVHNKSVTKYVHEGRVYVEGRSGSEFTLLVRNHTACQVLAVISVDGLSVMDGKTASKDGTGYIVTPFSTLKIPGWRLNNEDIAKFVFAGKDGSYAAKKSEDANVGVIGCAIFEEKQKDFFQFSGNYFNHNSNPSSATWTYFDTDTSDSTGSVVSWDNCTSTLDYGGEACCDSNVTSTNYVRKATRSRTPSSGKSSERIRECGEEPITQNIGTAFGKKSSHNVTEITFNRKDNPTQVFTLHYDDREGLKAKGVKVDRTVLIASPFPADKEQGCEPPADWNK